MVLVCTRRRQVIQKKSVLRPGFLKLPQSQIIVWLSTSCKHLDKLRTEVEKRFGIKCLSYIQLSNGDGFNDFFREDIPDLKAYCEKNGSRLYVVLVNEMGNERVLSFLMAHKIPALGVSLAGDAMSFRKALVETLKHVSTSR